jgi:hypothetical protein
MVAEGRTDRITLESDVSGTFERAGAKP